MKRCCWIFLLAVCPALAQDLNFAADRPLDLEHLRLEAKVDLPAKTLTGRAHLRMTALRGTDTIRLNAVNLDVRAVALVGSEATPAEFTNDGEHLDVHLPKPLTRGEQVTVRVDYVCARPQKGLFFYGPTKAEPDVPYQVWSQGETIDNRHWIPLFDHPNERLTSEMAITVKEGLKVLSNGKKAGHTRHENGTETWIWKQDTSHVPYLITLVVGDFHVYVQKWRGKTVDYWVPPDRADDTMRSFANTIPMLDFFSEKIGVEYPWDKYTQIVVEQFAFGGMENTSATTLNERTLHDERAHLDFSSDGLVAHELAHQWFGDLLTCRDWAHIWLNEGFATYFEALWAEHHKGDDEFRYNMVRKMRSAKSGGGKKLPIVHRAYQHPWDQFDSRAYPKGAWVLHMIRRRLGDELWWKAVNHYTSTHAHQCVETVDLRKSIEAVTGRSFERFFYDWTERPGHPDVHVHHRWDPQQKAAAVRIEQRQKAAAWHFPLRIEYRFANRPRAFVVTHHVTGKDVRFHVPLPARPAMVRVDPDFSVLMDLTEHKGRHLWVKQLMEDADPVARIRAAAHFGKSKRDQDRRQLADALGKEPVGGVQGEIAKALGQSGGTVSRDVLLKALSLEDPKARKEVVIALGKFKNDATVADALGAVVANGDASYYVEAAAIDAWAALRPEGALAKLEPLLARESHNHVVRNAALKGIGLQLDVAATGLLVEWTAIGRPRPNRRAALEGLATLAKTGEWDEPTTNRVVEAVTMCLEPSESRRIKRQAADTLRALGEHAYPALSTLEALAAHDPDASVRKSTQEAVDKIRSGAPTQVEVKKLREDLKKLREANQRMQRRIEQLDRKRTEIVESGG